MGLFGRSFLTEACRDPMEALDFYFDFVSPYSYLAHTQLGGLGAPVRLVPISVLRLMKLVNNTPTSITCSVKGAYLNTDLGRWAARYGVPFGAADMAKLDGRLLRRVATAAQGEATRATVTDAIFKAVWGKDGDASLDGLEDLLSGRGLPAAELIAAARQEAAAEALEAATKEAADHGVFGAPTLRLGRELFFGNDRLEFVREAVARVRESAL